MFTCQVCGNDFDDREYFWAKLGECIQCPHCKAWNATEWDYVGDEDDPYGNANAWTTRRASGPEDRD